MRNTRIFDFMNEGTSTRNGTDALLLSAPQCRYSLPLNAAALSNSFSTCSYNDGNTMWIPFH